MTKHKEMEKELEEMTSEEPTPSTRNIKNKKKMN